MSWIPTRIPGPQYWTELASATVGWRKGASASQEMHPPGRGSAAPCSCARTTESMPSAPTRISASRSRPSAKRNTTRSAAFSKCTARAPVSSRTFVPAAFNNVE